MNRLLAPIFITFFVGGCATIDYVPPVSGPRASLTVSSDNPAINTPIRLHDAECSNRSAKRVGWLNSRVAFAPATGDSLTFAVPAGKQIGLSVLPARLAMSSSTLTLTSCSQIVDFTPIDGAKYLLRAEIYESTQQCLYKLSRVLPSGEQVPEPSAQVRPDCTISLN